MSIIRQQRQSPQSRDDSVPRDRFTVWQMVYWVAGIALALVGIALGVYEKTRIPNLQEQTARCLDDVTKLQKQLTEARNQLADSSKSCEKERDSANEQIRSLNERVGTLTAELETSRKENDTLRNATSRGVSEPETPGSNTGGPVHPPIAPPTDAVPLELSWVRLQEPIALFDGTVSIIVTDISSDGYWNQGQRSEGATVSVRIRERAPDTYRLIPSNGRNPRGTDFDFSFRGKKYVVYLNKVNLDDKEARLGVQLARN